MKGILILFSIMFPLSLLADTPTCHDHPGGNYCKYTGKVANIYVNSGNVILMYFENAVDVSIPQSRGFYVTSGGAGALNISDNPDFASYFYSTALAAQASGRDVTVQMRGVKHGNLHIDRIWLSSP